MAANDKNYGNRKVYVASGGGGASSSQTGAKKPQFQKMAKKEKASPLPKLLMFIEVLIIVGCIMSPVFIGRKDRPIILERVLQRRLMAMIAFIISPEEEQIL